MTGNFYRLHPETDLVGMVADSKRAVAWLKAHATGYGLHPDRIVVAGGSAGGHLALMTAYTPGHPDLTPQDLHGSPHGSLHGSLAKAVVPSVYVEYPGAEHAFDLVLPRISSLAQPAWHDLERFLALIT